MKISELINILNGVKIIHGDIEVGVTASPKTDLYFPGVETAGVNQLPFIWSEKEGQMVASKAPVLLIVASEESKFAWEQD